jgi:hypothetical protein
MSEKQEAKSLNISLDANSIEILKSVDAIHRDSLINVGLSLVQKTGYYKTIAGINDTEDLEDVASLDLDDEGGTRSTSTKSTKKSTKEETKAPEKPKTTWDSF